MTTTNQDRRLLTMPEAAECLGVSTRFVRAAVRRGSISTVRIGRLVRFRPEHIEEFIESHSTSPQTGPAVVRATEDC